MEGNFHHPSLEWRRRIEAHYREGYKYSCPYCVLSKATHVFTATKFTLLCDHIVGSNADNTTQEHDELKATDGWYDPDWEDPREVGPSTATTEKYAQAGRKILRTYEIDTTPMRILGAPTIFGSGMQQSSKPPTPLPTRHDDSIHVGGLHGVTIPPQLESEIMRGFNPTLLALPQELLDDVQVTSKPHSAEDTSMGE